MFSHWVLVDRELRPLVVLFQCVALAIKIRGSLKSEWVPTTGYASFNEALTSIIQYIVGYYSQHRPHQHNGGLLPNKAEARYNLVSKAVASFT